jgi:hypothetical protein
MYRKIKLNEGIIYYKPDLWFILLSYFHCTITDETSWKK